MKRFAAVLLIILIVSSFAGLTCTSVYAGNPSGDEFRIDPYDPSKSADARENFNEAVGQIGTNMGFGAMVLGGIQLALSYRTDDPKHRMLGMKILVTGFLIMSLGVIAENFRF